MLFTFMKNLLSFGVRHLTIGQMVSLAFIAGKAFFKSNKVKREIASTVDSLSGTVKSKYEHAAKDVKSAYGSLSDTSKKELSAALIGIVVSAALAYFYVDHNKEA